MYAPRICDDTAQTSMGNATQFHLADLVREANVTLLPLSKSLTIADIRRVVPTGPVVVCDAFVDEIHEGGDELPWGYEKNGIINIDHHAPTARMRHFISSGMLACDYVAAHGALDPKVPIVINHTDCDSVISALIMRGILQPEDRWREAVLAADHSGTENAVADLLQALEDCRDLAFSAESLERLMRGEVLAHFAEERLAARRTERQAAFKTREQNLFEIHSGVVLVRPAQMISSDFFIPVFPEMELIISSTPRAVTEKGAAPRWDHKLRLGQSARPGLNLDVLKPEAFDEKFGGRWNTGSTSRSGGSLKTPEEYFAHYAELIERLSTERTE